MERARPTVAARAGFIRSPGDCVRGRDSRGSAGEYLELLESGRSEAGAEATRPFEEGVSCVAFGGRGGWGLS